MGDALSVPFIVSWYKLISVRKGKINYAKKNNRENVTLGSYKWCEF